MLNPKIFKFGWALQIYAAKNTKIFRNIKINKKMQLHQVWIVFKIKLEKHRNNQCIIQYFINNKETTK